MKINAKEFDKIAKKIFAPAYPVIAEDILKSTGISRGTCLDIGSGGGYLGLAIAKKTSLLLKLVDESHEMIKIAKTNINENLMEHRAEAITGLAESIPLENNSINLVVSRGSVFFWENRVEAFKEIYRVLSPLGTAWIGGGFGSMKIKNEITKKMEALNKGSDKWQKRVNKNTDSKMIEAFKEELRKAEIPEFTIKRSEEKGLWVVFSKN